MSEREIVLAARRNELDVEEVEEAVKRGAKVTFDGLLEWPSSDEFFSWVAWMIERRVKMKKWDRLFEDVYRRFGYIEDTKARKNNDNYLLKSLLIPGWGLISQGDSSGWFILVASVLTLVFGLWLLSFIFWLIGVVLTATAERG